MGGSKKDDDQTPPPDDKSAAKAEPASDDIHWWEMAEDRCQTCGKFLGYGVRFLHIGHCESCPPIKH